ncbi:hypothetical protein ACH5RR_020446 [Cinchona calisaya]|uniref:Uncharacterized protein n=1 Tax=Cinchona calisaya TaxID=153742 RepID=A0ABD2ZEF9_9GENT
MLSDAVSWFICDLKFHVNSIMFNDHSNHIGDFSSTERGKLHGAIMMHHILCNSALLLSINITKEQVMGNNFSSQMRMFSSIVEKCKISKLRKKTMTLLIIQMSCGYLFI